VSGQAALKRRDSARLFVISSSGNMLLFRFSPPNRAAFWATAGGALDEGENFERAARRELWEETGLDQDVGSPIAVRTNRFTAHWGDEIVAEEHYFIVRTDSEIIDISGHEEIEREIMKEYRWFAPAELDQWHEDIFPPDIKQMLEEFILEP
jgi:8-oxo-dGTP diphosphatase